MRANWRELFRHFFASSDVDPFEVRRRAGRANVTQLRVLDLTVPAVQTALQIDDNGLVDDDHTRCQDIADVARAAGLDGVLAPSAGLAGERNPRLSSPQHWIAVPWPNNPGASKSRPWILRKSLERYDRFRPEAARSATSSRG
jgi:hypothetical protein